MKLNKETYYCSHCKKVFDSDGSLYSIDNQSNRLFCSEECIDNYFVPMVKYYEDIEKSLREELKCKKEDCQKFAVMPKYMEQVLQKPDEIWCLKNKFNEEIYSFISYLRDNKEEEFFQIVLCLVLDYQPSYVFIAVSTRNHALMREFQIGHRLTDISEFIRRGKEAGEQSLQVDSDMIDLLENKKSSLLASMLGQRSPADIPYESFYLYDDYYQDTLENPDEIYDFQDDDKDKLFVYIKAHHKDSVSFYYFVICIDYDDAGLEASKKVLLPIISFPSVDPNLYHSFKKGQQIFGKIQN